MKRRDDSINHALTRRGFFRTTGPGAAALTLGTPSGCEPRDVRSGAERRRHDAVAGAAHLPRPSPARLAWQRAELGVLVSRDLHVFEGRRYHQGRNRITPISDIDLFAAAGYDI